MTGPDPVGPGRSSRDADDLAAAEAERAVEQALALVGGARSGPGRDPDRRRDASAGDPRGDANDAPTGSSHATLNSANSANSAAPGGPTPT
ncbi:molybdopterin molybdenumtransferase MoeA, partial [Streptomyces sp. McG3]|nr:molybdopterin molybdenumtransferase MoeA [Streptomyces sp. McG3]